MSESDPSVVAIYLADVETAPVRSVNSAVAVAGQGLEGDRYFVSPPHSGPDREITLIESEAIKAVPQAQREGAYALGASRWQMVRSSVLPAAAPGIMTGIILAMARAIGEAAPLVVVGAAAFVTSLPQPLSGSFTVLPIQVFNWAQRPQADFQGIAAAAIIVILVLVFILNLLALVVRARLSRHIQW